LQATTTLRSGAKQSLLLLLGSSRLRALAGMRASRSPRARRAFCGRAFSTHRPSMSCSSSSQTIGQTRDLVAEAASSAAAFGSSPTTLSDELPQRRSTLLTPNAIGLGRETLANQLLHATRRSREDQHGIDAGLDGLRGGRSSVGPAA